MATISKLSVQLAADTAPFSSSMKAASKRLGSFASKVKATAGGGLSSFGSGLAKIGGGLVALGKKVLNAGMAFAKFAIKGVLIAATALAVFVAKAFMAIDDVAKLSKQLGLSTESITAYSLAAEQAGIDNTTFTKSLSKFNRTLGEAKLGIGEGATAFKQLGLSQQDVAKMSPDDALNAVAEKLSKVKDKAIQAALAQDLFGRAGGKLIPLLDGGAKGLAAFREQADRLGISFNSLDAQKVENANDALGLMKKSFTGIFTQLAIKVAPFVERFAELVTNAVVDFRNNTLPIIIDWVNTAIKAFRGFLEKVLPVFFSFANGVADALNWGIDMFIAFGNIVAEVFNGFMNGSDDAKTSFDDFVDGIGFGINFAVTAFQSFGNTVDVIMFNIISTVADMVLGFINLIKKIPGIEAGLEFQKGLGFDIEGIVKEIKTGSDALKEEAEDTLVDKFIAQEKKSKDKTDKQTKNFLKGFDKFLGFGKFGFKIPKLEGKVGGVGDLGLGDKTKTKAKPQELKALQKGSAEAFRAINAKQTDPLLDVAKIALKAEEEQLKVMKKMNENLKNNAIIVVPA